MSGDRYTSESYEQIGYGMEFLEELYQSRSRTADVHLIPGNALDENDHLPCHKSIIATKSQYFQDLFFTKIKTEPKVDDEDTPQCPPVQSTSKVSLPIDKVILEIVLRGIYLGQYVISLGRWERLLEASKLLKLDKLTQKCYDFLHDQGVTKETWAFHFRLALENNNNEDMLERIYQFLKTIPPQILDTPGFAELKFIELKMLVDAGVWAYSTDLQRAKFKWYSHETHLRILYMDDLVKLDVPKVDSTSNPQDKSNENPPQDLPMDNPDQPTAPANPNGQSQIHPQPSTSTGPPHSPPISSSARNPDGLSEPENKRPLETVSSNNLNACDSNSASTTSTSPIDSDFAQAPNLTEDVFKRRPGRPRKNPLQTKTPPTSEDAPKTAGDAGDTPQPPTDVQAPVPKRRGRPPSNKKLQELKQPSKSPRIEKKEADRPSQVPTPSSPKGLGVSLSPRVEVKLKTTETESVQSDEVIDSATNTEDMAHESLSNDHVRKKRAREDEEETSRKTSKVEEKKSSTSSSNEFKDKPGSSSSVDSGSESSSFDPNGRGNESIKEINDESAGIPQEPPTSTIKTPDYSDDPGQHEGAQKPIYCTKIVNGKGSFNAVVLHCSHNPGELEPPFFPEPPLTFIGHINPETVWNYIAGIVSAQMKKKSKEVIVFRLEPASIADEEDFMTFFTNLSSENRLGVLGGGSAPINDVILLSLDKDTPIPPALLPFQGPGLSKDRNHSLLAIVVRDTPVAPI